MKKNNSILKINKKNIVKNLKFFQKLKKELIVAPTIKANAYGLGDKEIFKLMRENNCKHFFVATLNEGIKLNNKNKNISIYVLNGIQNYDLNLFSSYNLIPIINTISELKRINKSKLSFGLHVDTGINRLGINFNHIPKSVFLNNKISLVISHLASADERINKYNNIQQKRFCDISNKFKSKDIIFSLANSSGATLSKSYLFNMVRPGISLYGGNNKNIKLKKNLKSVITLSGKIIQIKKIIKNEYIGYNQTFKTKKNIKVAIIGIGYADGIPRKLSNNGQVYYKDNKFNIIGRISMDSFTIDITKSKHNLKVGMFIDLINDRYDVENLANQCGTISNEILTSIGTRVLRVYE